MTPEERQAIFDKEGYWPTEYVPRKPSQRELAEQRANRLQAGLRSTATRGWKAPLHWSVPPAFDRPGRIYEELGHEAFCEAVQEYYQAISQAHLTRAGEVHTRWAIRQILRTFETHVRGFRGQSVSKGGPYSRGGRVFATASDVLVLPETLKQDGRLLADLEGYLAAYGVRPEDRPMARQTILLKLNQSWGI
jgi:hypothetical protein